MSAAPPLHTNLPLPAQNPGPGRVLRCRASTACPASWSASPPRAPPLPLFCWPTRRRRRLQAGKRRPPGARSSAAAPPLPPTPPLSAQRVRTPTRSTRCSEGLGGLFGGVPLPSGPRDGALRVPRAQRIELKCQLPSQQCFRSDPSGGMRGGGTDVCFRTPGQGHGPFLPRSTLP